MERHNVGDLGFLNPMDFVVRGNSDMFYIFGSGDLMPIVEGRDKHTVAAALRYWADRLEADR